MLISPSLVPQATAALDWNINAAEGAFRDYNRDTNSNGNAAVRDFFSPDPYRTSDHDPVLLDLKLGRTLPSGLSFSHGVASGDPYADSVILWTRVTPPAGFAGLLDVRWEVSRSAGFEAGSIIDAGVFATSDARDWTVKVLADGLNADTTYYYRFGIGDVESMVGQTKTLPVDSDAVRLAVFSCANFTAAEQFAAYGRAASINAVNPYDALVHLGDYIYEYGPGGYGAAEDAATDRGFLPNREIISLDDYRQRYAQYHTDQNLQDLRAAAPLIAIWDDHETANDSWSGGAENHQPGTEGDWIARRDAALKAYHEWLPIRDPDQRQASDGATALSPLSQGYRSFNFGEVLSLHVLETRLTARDEQLEYPDAAAVQARIGAILTNPTELLAYAGKLGLTPPTTPQAIPAFAAAIAPLVTQELVLATVQKAWGDPSRDLIGDPQLAWLQNQMGQSKASWQVLGQGVLMQSMAVPAELLLKAGDPSLLDKYAAPLQKLATGTAFAELSAAEQALFSETGKIPYNLDPWDGYGVERETILQTALAQGKRLISLAGDTHNAWSGVLDTMSAGSKPAGTLAGVEFATPGVTSPGLEKYLPGADAYIRAKYPAVDGLDGLFSGYVNGLKYADLNRRGFLDLTVNKDQAVGTFQLLDGVNPLSGQPQWASEAVVASGDFKLSVQPEATPQITWQSGWRELDLVFGMAVDINGGQTLLDPYTFATLPRSGVQLADVSLLGSQNTDRIFAGVGSLVDGAAGDDELFNIDSLGGNQLVGGLGADQLFLQAANDRVIGGLLFSDATAMGLTPFSALVDRERDSFLIDSSDPGNSGSLEILDYEPGIDKLLIDGVAPTGDWAAVRQQLQGLNVAVNAAPQLSGTPVVISLKSGVEVTRDLSAFGLDLDGDALQLLKLSGPEWISTNGTVLKATVPASLTEEQLAGTPLLLGFSDGKAVSSFVAKLTLNGAPTALSLANTTPSLAENTSTASRIKVADIVIADDNLGSNVISLSGTDAASFEVVGTALFLKAGVVLNFEAKTSYAVKVRVADPALPDSNPLTSDYSLAIQDVNEVPGFKTVTTVVEVTLPNGSVKPITVSIDNAGFAPGTNLSVISDLGINPAVLTSLAKLGVTTNNSGLDFQLTVDQGASASLNALLDLVAADLVPQLTNPTGARRADRKLLYYAVNPTTGGGISPLTFDPITGAGARFFDLDNNGTADFFSLSLIDGGYGDKDGLANGVIDDPSVAGFADLTNLRFSSAGSGSITISDPTNAAPAAVSLRATLSSRSSRSNQIGYVVLNPSEVANSAALLSDLTWLRSRSRTLLTSLENTDVTLPTGISFDRDIQLINGQIIRFFEVDDASLEQLTSLSDSRFRFLNPGEISNGQVAFSSNSGVRFSLNLLPSDPGLNALISQAQGQAAVLDLSAFTTAQSLSGTLAIAREADFNSVAGFYRTLDAAGTVLGADSITRFRPGDSGYTAAALRTDNIIGQLGNLSVGDNQTTTRSFSGVNGGTFLAPFAQVNGNSFFTFGGANTDRLSHFRSLGNNLFGFEDTLGGGDKDYDDMVIGFSFTNVV
jgi:phosphodiesterase/alkaline phosphatase D-like protein